MMEGMGAYFERCRQRIDGMVFLPRCTSERTR
jgi:hypothetical protein